VGHRQEQGGGRPSWAYPAYPGWAESTGRVVERYPGAGRMPSTFWPFLGINGCPWLLINLKGIEIVFNPTFLRQL
jgi:hypothetical protein